jgi:hypothetical protein
MSEPRDLGADFTEFFSSMRTLAGNPTTTEMWLGFRKIDVSVSPASVAKWASGRGFPSNWFKTELMGVFELSEIEYNNLRAGSESRRAAPLKQFSRQDLIGALVDNVVSGPLLNPDDSRQLGELIMNHTAQPDLMTILAGEQNQRQD